MLKVPTTGLTRSYWPEVTADIASNMLPSLGLERVHFVGAMIAQSEVVIVEATGALLPPVPHVEHG